MSDLESRLYSNNNYNTYNNSKSNLCDEFIIFKSVEMNGRGTQQAWGGNSRGGARTIIGAPQRASNNGYQNVIDSDAGATSG